MSVTNLMGLIKSFRHRMILDGDYSCTGVCRTNGQKSNLGVLIDWGVESQEIDGNQH